MPLLPPDQVKTIGALSTVGLAFVLAIVLGTAAGWWIDERFGSSPWGFLIGFALGLAAGVLNVFRITGRAMR